jgi:lysozyme
MAIDNIIDQLKRDEGLRLDVYMDTVGKRTIGYGHNLDANPIPALVTPINETLASQILGVDVERISRFLVSQLPWVVSLDDARLGVMQNMSFNLGVPGLLQFHHDLADTQAGNYEQAAADMKASKWYTEVGDRAVRLVEQMRSGIWQ